MSVAIKVNFKKDFFTNEIIDYSFYRQQLKEKYKNDKKNFYLCQMAELYYLDKYNVTLQKIIEDKFYDLIPKCPIKNIPVKIWFKGRNLTYSKFSSECTISEIQNWNVKNNPKVLANIQKMKIERKGENNPCYGKVYTDEERKKHSELMKTISPKVLETKSKWSDEKKKEVSKKMSVSAKKSAIECENRGMKNKKHSAETIVKLRNNTLDRIKNGVFKQNDTYICRAFEKLLNKLNIEYEKEFRYGHFAFDFKAGNYLIEIQGDYWHCNPNIEKFKDKWKTNETLKRNYARDKSKRLEVQRKNEYELLEFWETDINKNFDKIELCLKELFPAKK